MKCSAELCKIKSDYEHEFTIISYLLVSKQDSYLFCYKAGDWNKYHNYPKFPKYKLYIFILYHHYFKYEPEVLQFLIFFNCTRSLPVIYPPFLIVSIQILNDKNSANHNLLGNMWISLFYLVNEIYDLRYSPQKLICFSVHRGILYIHFLSPNPFLYSICSIGSYLYNVIETSSKTVLTFCKKYHYQWITLCL